MWGTSGQCHRATFTGTRSPGWKATSQDRRGKPGVQGQREQGEKQDRRGAGEPVGSTCALREEAYWGPTHTQPEGRSCQTDGLTEGSPRGGSNRTASLPKPLRRDPRAAGRRGRLRRGRVRPAPPLSGYCALPPPSMVRPAGSAPSSPPPTPLAQGRCRPRALPPPASGPVARVRPPDLWFLLLPRSFTSRDPLTELFPPASAPPFVPAALRFTARHTPPPTARDAPPPPRPVGT